MSLCCANMAQHSAIAVTCPKKCGAFLQNGYIFLMTSVKFLIISCKIVSKWYLRESTFVTMLVSV